jgi:hypothetical protein
MRARWRPHDHIVEAVYIFVHGVSRVLEQQHPSRSGASAAPLPRRQASMRFVAFVVGAHACARPASIAHSSTHTTHFSHISHFVAVRALFRE